MSIESEVDESDKEDETPKSDKSEKEIDDSKVTDKKDTTEVEDTFEKDESEPASEHFDVDTTPQDTPKTEHIPNPQRAVTKKDVRDLFDHIRVHFIHNCVPHSKIADQFC